MHPNNPRPLLGRHIHAMKASNVKEIAAIVLFFGNCVLLAWVDIRLIAAQTLFCFAMALWTSNTYRK